MDLGSVRYFTTRAWLSVNRRLASRNPNRAPEIWGNRRRLVQELAPGRSFLDLGGMYGVSGDVAFWAEEAGATRVMLFDGMDPSDDFAAKHAARGSSVRYRQGDLGDPDDVRLLGSWDVVWCAGVIYHSPDPFSQLRHLRSITAQTLLLGSYVVPEIPGLENGCIFFPGRSAPSESAFAAFSAGGASGYPGMAAPFITTDLMGYANMWWGFSPSALRSMLRYAGFEVDREFSYSSAGMDILASTVAEPSYIPGPGWSRRHANETLEAMDPTDRPTWWDQPVD